MSCLHQNCSFKDDNLQRPAKFLSWVAVLIADIHLMYAKHIHSMSVYRPLILQTFQICFEILSTSFRIKSHRLRSCTTLLEDYNLIINLICKKSGIWVPLTKFSWLIMKCAMHWLAVIFSLKELILFKVQYNGFGNE